MNAQGAGLTFAAAALVVDQGSKVVALNSSALERGIELLPVLRLVLVRNEGVAFGMLGGVVPWWALTALALAVMAVLVRWLWRTSSRLLGAALGLVVGGAIGNVIDRLRHGAVTDFLDAHVAGYHWPAFNLADVAVVCGVALMLAAPGRKV